MISTAEATPAVEPIADPRPESPAVNVDAIPAEMKTPACTVWNFVYRSKPGKPGKWTKQPVNARTGGNAMSNNPETWAPFDAAESAYRTGNYDGIGFMLHDGIGGADLDNALDAEMNPLPWAKSIIERACGITYVEYTPRLRGVHIIGHVAKPYGFKRAVPNGRPGEAVEIYSSGKPAGNDDGSIAPAGRFFTVTGLKLDGAQNDLGDCSELFAELDRLTAKSKPDPQLERGNLSDVMPRELLNGNGKAKRPPRMTDEQVIKLASNTSDGTHFEYLMSGGGEDASAADQAFCNRLAFYGCDDSQIDSIFRRSPRMRPKWDEVHYETGETYGGRTIDNAIADTHTFYDPKPKKQADQPDAEPLAETTLGVMADAHPEMNRPMVKGIARATEVVNFVSVSKGRKTLAMMNLAACIALGRPWLGMFDTHCGRVLYVDDELHQSTIAKRFKDVCQSMGVFWSDVRDKISILSLRGRLRPLPMLESFFMERAGKYDVIVLDSLYRLAPEGFDENSNSDVTAVYNLLDKYAAATGATFVCVHHASKGEQAGKSTIDVGAGAGAQSRAVDAHIVLREHQEPDCVVMSMALRSWAPIEPMCLRWVYPLWTAAPDLDPSHLKTFKPKRAAKVVEPKPEPIVWTVESFAAKYVTAEPQSADAITVAANADMSERQAAKLLKVAIEKGVVYRHYTASNAPEKYATVEPTLISGVTVEDTTTKKPKRSKKR